MSLRINKICRTVLLLVFIACVFGFFATTFNRSVQAEDVAAENFYTEDGASVRYNADTPGIRFTSYITENYYNELKQKAADGVLNFYTLIEKADGSSSSKVKIEHKQSVEFNESGTAVFNAALVFKKASGDLTATEIKEASAIELKASAYVRYTDNMGQTVTESAANGGVVRSMRGIANYAIRVGVSEEQSNFLSMYLGNITIENVLQKVVLTDKAAVELFGLTEGAVYIGAKKVGDIAGGKIDLSLVTLPTDSTTEVYVFDKDNNCTIYTCLFVQPLTLTENYVVGLNRPSSTYAYTLQGEEPIISVKVGGTEIASSDYLQSGNSVTLNASAFTAAGDTSVVIETSAAVYSGRAEVYDIAIGSLEEFKAFWSREGIPADSTVTSKIVLTADIDASSYSFHGGNVLMGFTFDGILDGKGHTIKGAPSSYFGLMRTLGINGVIKNVAFTGIKFFRTSAIINDQLNGRIENCYFEGSGGNGAEDNALCKYIQNNTAVLKNVVVYLHDRPSGTETQCGMFRSSLSLTTAPKGIYFINTSSNGKICDGAGTTDLSDVHLYSSLAEFTTEVTELPAGFTRELWHMGENGLAFGKVLDAIQLTENHVVGLNRPSATYAYTLQGEEPIVSVKVGGTEIASSDYLQSGNSVTLNASAFTAAGDTSVVIETSAAVYSGRAEVYDIAINYKEQIATFKVEYGFNTVFVFRYNEKISAVRLAKSCTAEDLFIPIPDGFRIKKIYGDNTGRAVMKENAENPLENEISYTGNTSLKEPIYFDLELTDEWSLSVNYLTQYLSTPFAVLNTKKLTVKVNDFPDIYKLTPEEVARLVGTDISVLKMKENAVMAEEVKVAFNGVSGYTVNLKYSVITVVTKDSDGNNSYLNVGLTPFSIWRERFGEDWTLTYIAPDVFRFSQEVKYDKLYGFFALATFSEQVRNFNSWFKEFTSAGCSVIFNKAEVKGSGLYRFARENASSLIIGGAATGAVLGMFCGAPLVGAIVGAGAGALFSLTTSLLSEMASDENAKYYTYFFYLDGTTDEAYVAHNGADDISDNDSALTNKGENILDKVTKSEPGKAIGIIFGVTAAVVIVLLFIRIILWLFPKKPKER